MLFSTAGTAGKARLTIAPDGPPGEGSGLQEHIRGETGGRRGPAGRHRAASGGPRRGSGRGRRQGEPEWQAVSPTACRSGPPGPGLPMKKERLVLQQTSNYQLSQWDAEYRIQREDFNADNAKIDGALAALAAKDTVLETLIGQCGNCKLWTTTYVGTGSCGSDHPNTLSFPEAPLMVMIHGGTGNAWGVYAEKMGVFLRGSHILVPQVNSAVLWPATWSVDRKTVSWYTVNSTAEEQLNAGGVTYTVTVLLAAD